MMEKYVVSRELAEKLKAAGYPVNTSQHIWVRDTRYPDQDWYVDTTQGKMESEMLGHEYFAAPLSDELLEQLPIHTELSKPLNGLGGGYEAKLVEVFTRSYDNGKTFWEYKPADALAELWLWCKENGYIK